MYFVQLCLIALIAILVSLHSCKVYIPVKICDIFADQENNFLFSGATSLYRLSLLWQDCYYAIEYSVVQCVW